MSDWDVSSSEAHLLSELEWLGLLVRAQVHRARQVADADHPYRGLFIPEEEVERLLEGGRPSWLRAPPPLPPEALQRALQAGRRDLDQATLEALTAGVPLRWPALCARLGLRPLQRQLLLIALAPELDGRFERLYAYLHDDVSRRRPSPGLALDLLDRRGPARLAGLRELDEGGWLRASGALVWRARAGVEGPQPLVSGELLVSEVALGWLLGRDALPPALDGLAVHQPEPRPLDALLAPAQTHEALRAALPGLEAGARLLLLGEAGSGRSLAAEGLARALGRPLMEVQLGALSRAQPEVSVDALRLAARLRGAALLWSDLDALDALPPALRRPPPRGAPPEMLSASPAWAPPDDLEPLIERRLSPLTDAHRARLLRRCLEGAPGLDALDLDAVASTFRLDGRRVEAAAVAARQELALAGPGAALGLERLAEACRRQSRRGLSRLATRVPPRRSWEQLVLPPEPTRLLRGVSDRVRHQIQVFERWGLRARAPEAVGQHVLLAGPPGTGKTLAAEVVASDLGLDLFKVDLSRVVSKYIGETEKQLAQLFQDARANSAVLFFDEADALFGRRTQIADAHDRYANVQVSFLLQEMEQHEGLVLLATNLKGNLDAAFLRRFAVVVDLALPDEAQRRRIWEVLLPPALPTEALDLDALARVRLSGGEIRSALVTAAFAAAAAGAPLSMPLLVEALRDEHLKAGRPFRPDTLGAHAAPLRIP